jgi:hypothetical protein
MLAYFHDDRCSTASNDNGHFPLPQHNSKDSLRKLVALAPIVNGTIILDYLADGIFIISRRLVAYRTHVLPHRIH